RAFPAGYVDVVDDAGLRVVRAGHADLHVADAGHVDLGAQPVDHAGDRLNRIGLLEVDRLLQPRPYRPRHVTQRSGERRRVAHERVSYGDRDHVRRGRVGRVDLRVGAGTGA